MQPRSEKGCLPAVLLGMGVHFLYLLLFETCACTHLDYHVIGLLVADTVPSLLGGQELADTAVEHKQEAQVNRKTRKNSFKLGATKHQLPSC